MNKEYFYLNDNLIIPKIKDFCTTNPYIVYINQTIGGSDFDIDIIVKDKDHLSQILSLMQKTFPQIREWEYFICKKYHSLNYFPSNKITL